MPSCARVVSRAVLLLFLVTAGSLSSACGGDDGDASGGNGGQAGTGGTATGGTGGTGGTAGAGTGGTGAAAGEGGSAGEAGGTGGTGGSAPLPPEILTLGDQTVAEDATLLVPLTVTSTGSAARVWVEGLPPGARFDEAARAITFTPDFIQGGDSWTVTVHASNEAGSASTSFEISAQDTITPPLPSIDATVSGSGYTKLAVTQTTDAYLDSAGHAGRTFSARVYVPEGASASNRVPVRVYLHGFGGSPYDGTSSGGQFRIYPHDPANTYWWGYGDGLPGGDSASAPNYTQRRVLHLLEWVLRTHPGADPDRVYVTGGSMGGAGAATLGLLYARHFAFVEATIGQMVPRNHRPARVTQLEGLWGSPEDNLLDGTFLEDGTSMGVWDRQDLCRALRDMPEARDQFVFTKHGKDDPTIHFGAVTHDSPLTQRSYYRTVQEEAIGHYAVWDEGGHGSEDPVMGASWWDDDFSLLFDSVSYLRRDRAFPAFTRASHDWDPGDGTGNGKQTWSDSSGYAGTVSTVGDTGWSGEIAGALNRFLRWDTNGVVDERDRFEMPLFVVDGEGSDAPQAGYPSRGDRFDGTLPVQVDVTLRRVRAFKCLAGEQVRWEFEGQSGTVEANADGSVTVPQVALDTQPRTLVLTREPGL